MPFRSLVHGAAVLVAAAWLAVGLVASRAADAAFRGANGAIAYVSGGEVLVWDVDEQAEGGLASGIDPAWSPDGRKLAYASFSGGSLDVYVADRHGVATRVVADPQTHDAGPAWSPDGTKLAFVRSPRGGGRADIWTVNADGGGARLLRQNAFDPSWSPDGTRIAFWADGPGGSQIFTMTPEGVGLTQLTTGLSRAYSPDWSPDGMRVAFVGQATDALEIYTMDAAGGDLRALTSGGRTDCRQGCTIPRFSPAWSPDGSRIAFAHDAGGQLRLYVADADGSDRRPLATLSEAGSDGSPTWQPAVDLALTQRGGARRSRVGQRVTFSVTLRNLSTLAASEVTVRGSLSGAARIRATLRGRPCAGGRAYVCELDSLGPRELATLQIAIVPTRAGRVVHRLVAESAEADARGRDNSLRTSLRASSAKRRP